MSRCKAYTWNGKQCLNEEHTDGLCGVHYRAAKKKCDQCGGDFMALRGRAKYCSRSCRDKARYERPPETMSCAHCNKEFKPTRAIQKYCTKRCGNAAADQRSGKVRKPRETPVDRVAITDQDTYFYSLVNTNTKLKERACLRCRKMIRTTANNRICASCTGSRTPHRRYDI